MKRKLLTIMFLLAFSISTFAALGVGGASAGLTLTTGLNSPQGTNVVAGPAPATGGAVTAFNLVVENVPGGDIANLEVSFAC